MKNKYIQIKDRTVQIPTHVNEVSWQAGRKLLEYEEKKGEPLTHIDVCICFLGEDEEFWRSYEDVPTWMEWAFVLYKVYADMKRRQIRSKLKKVLLIDFAVRKPPLKRWVSVIKGGFNRKRRVIDTLPYNEIIFNEKEYTAPSDLRWKPVGQYHDALQASEVIHEKTEFHLRNEAIERLFKIYFYPIVTGEIYSPDKALAWDIKGARYVDVEDFASFFLLRCKKFLGGTLPAPLI